MNTLSDLIDNNHRWAEKKTAEDPEFFSRLAGGQAPKYLWIGCSDSRMPAERMTGLQPGELFVHRNVANVVRADDNNLMAVLRYAVEALKVEHVIVCGHHGCGGVQAALEGGTDGVIKEWLTPIEAEVAAQTEALAGIEGKDRINRMAELNVLAQTKSLAATGTVQKAWAGGQSLSLHSWIYRLGEGRLHSLADERSS